MQLCSYVRTRQVLCWLTPIYFISFPTEPQYPRQTINQHKHHLPAPRYTHQINLIELDFDILVSLLGRKHNPSSPRHINIIIGVNLESIVHATVQHDLIITAEVDLRRRVSARSNMCPKTVAKVENFWC